MDCPRVKELLSEYIDGTLEAEDRDRVDQHLLACAACRDELESLRALVRELGSLESVQPPDDFLDQLHERMEPRFSVRRVVRALFVPARIKIPLELATALTAAIIIFSALSIQYSKTDLAGMGDKADLKTAQGPAAGRERPMEIVLVLEDRTNKAGQKGAGRKKSEPQLKAQEDLPKKGADPLAEEARSARQSKTARPVPSGGETPAVGRVRSLIALAEGQVISMEPDAPEGRSTILTAKIPSKNYAIFLNGLESMGKFAAPPPVPDREKEGILTIRILILPPQDQR
jgi:hypothetical protein